MDRRYDSDMIRDFFGHLLCEVRIGEIENAGLKPDIEIVKVLARFIQKYRAPRLIHGKNTDRSRQALALEYLRPLIEEALRLSDGDAPTRLPSRCGVLKRIRQVVLS